MSTSLSIQGRIVKRGPVEEFGAKKFRKALLVVEIDGQKYNNQVPFEVTKDALKGYDALRVGDAVEVFFNLNGREWNGKHYSSAEAWRIARPGAEQTEAGSFDPAEPIQEGGEENDAGLPF